MTETGWIVFLALLAAGLLGLALYDWVLRPAMKMKRELARSVHSYGAAPRDLLECAWTGQDYRGLEEQLLTWTRAIERVVALHRLFSAFHIFDTDDADREFSLAIAKLDEAISILWFIVPEDQRPRERIIRPLRSAIESLLRDVQRTGVDRSASPPPLPSLPSALEYPKTKLKKEFFRSTAERRRLLLGWVEHHVGQWPESF